MFLLDIKISKLVYISIFLFLFNFLGGVFLFKLILFFFFFFLHVNQRKGRCSSPVLRSVEAPPSTSGECLTFRMLVPSSLTLKASTLPTCRVYTGQWWGEVSFRWVDDDCGWGCGCTNEKGFWLAIFVSAPKCQDTVLRLTMSDRPAGRRYV